MSALQSIPGRVTLNVRSVVRGKVEQIQLPDDIKQVDIIISEWMGYALLYESMLDSVLHARDRFLRPGGVMAPSQTKMMFGLCDAAEIYKERVAFWSDIYGRRTGLVHCRVSLMLRRLRLDRHGHGCIRGGYRGRRWSRDHGQRTRRREGRHQSAPTPAPVLTSPQDLYLPDVTPRQLDFSSPFKLTATTARTTKIHAFVLYFDTFFNETGAPVPADTPVAVAREGDPILAEVWQVGGRRHLTRRMSSGEAIKPHEPKIVSFSTGPLSVPTHWKQTLFLLREPIVADEGTPRRPLYACWFLVLTCGVCRCVGAGRVQVQEERGQLARARRRDPLLRQACRRGLADRRRDRPDIQGPISYDLPQQQNHVSIAAPLANAEFDALPRFDQTSRRRARRDGGMATQGRRRLGILTATNTGLSGLSFTGASTSFIVLGFPYRHHADRSCNSDHVAYSSFKSHILGTQRMLHAFRSYSR